MPAHLRIVAFNDVYTLENLPRMATLVAEARAGVDRLLVVLAGDFVAPSVLSSLDDGRGMVACMNALGVTHVTFGNHEDDIPHAQLLARIRELRAKWLATNVRGLEVPLPTCDVVTVGEAGPGKTGLRVGLLGVVLVDPLVYRRPPFGGVLEDPEVAALRESKRLQDEEKCALVVVLTHQSLAADRALAKALHGTVPILLGGHEHTACDETVEGTRILKAGSEAACANVVDVVWPDVNDGKTRSISSRLVAVKGYAEDAALRALVETHMRPVHALERASLLELLPGTTLSSIGARAKQTSLGAVVCSRLRDVLGAEACIFNGGGIRAAREYHERFTYGDLEAEVPFDNEIDVVSLPGSVLQEAICASRAAAPAETGAFLQVDDGITLAADQRSVLAVAHAAFEPSRDYRVAVVRDLFLGLDRIEPLVRFAREHPERIPAVGSSRTPKELLVRSFSAQLWKQLGGFDVLDRNHDGKVTSDEIAAALEDAHKGEAAELVAELVLHALDVDRDDAISPQDAAERTK